MFSPSLEAEDLCDILQTYINIFECYPLSAKVRGFIDDFVGLPIGLKFSKGNMTEFLKHLSSDISNLKAWKQMANEAEEIVQSEQAEWIHGMIACFF